MSLVFFLSVLSNSITSAHASKYTQISQSKQVTCKLESSMIPGVYGFKLR